MAGGQTPMLPFFLHRWEVAALRANFGVNSLFELMGRKLTPADYDKLKKCVTDEHYHLFLQNLFGPLESPQLPRQPGYGPNSLGLKTTIAARWESVRQQLTGERPASQGDGSGNGGSMWMVDIFMPPQ
jgi:hypothetical protein